MMRKSIIVGVSVTPEVGLEVAQIDFATQTVLKYGVRQLEYDAGMREIADIDIFKETLQDLFFDLQIPKGSEVVLNFPSITFKVNDYPASLDESQITNAVEEELSEHFIFKSVEPVVSVASLPNSSIQFFKIASTALQKSMLIEMAMYIKEIGYKLVGVDTSVNSTLNSLIYKGLVNVESDMSWVLLIVDNMTCRVIPMNGNTYVDSFEERVSIGKVLDDAENYSTVINAVNPILKNLPSKYLCVVSKTNIISAEILASKLTYSAPIIHQEANAFAKEAFIEAAEGVDEKLANLISLDVVGAAIYKDFEPYSSAHFNLFNRSLGDIYLMEQPPEIKIGNKTIVLTNSLITSWIILSILLIGLPALLFYFMETAQIQRERDNLSDLEIKITQMQQFLNENENISSELFDEGDEIRIGLEHNKNVYSYYTIVGTEIPKKLWLTHLKLGSKTTIEGQADNLESIYAFFKSIKDYDPNSAIKLQKLGLASKSNLQMLDGTNGEFDTDSILTSLNADFYEFKISDETPAVKPKDGSSSGLPGLEVIEENN